MTNTDIKTYDDIYRAVVEGLTVIAHNHFGNRRTYFKNETGKIRGRFNKCADYHFNGSDVEIDSLIQIEILGDRRVFKNTYEFTLGTGKRVITGYSLEHAFERLGYKGFTIQHNSRPLDGTYTIFVKGQGGHSSTYGAKWLNKKA